MVATTTTMPREYTTKSNINTIGSIDVQTIGTNYTISHMNHEHPMYSSLFQSFQSNDVDISNFISKAESIIPLSQLIQGCDVYDKKKSSTLNTSKGTSCLFNIQTATTLLHSMYSQIHFLLEQGIGISFIDVDDIMVVNGTQFYFCNFHKLYKIKNDQTMMITDFYDLQNSFLPPEFVANNRIPFNTYYTSSFYSLAILILFCLKYSNHAFSTDMDKDSIAPYHSILEQYQHTKLHVTLKHCLIEDPIQRTLHIF